MVLKQPWFTIKILIVFTIHVHILFSFLAVKFEKEKNNMFFKGKKNSWKWIKLDKMGTLMKWD